jgi:hypothetical protein
MSAEIDYGDVSQVARATDRLLKRWKSAYLDMRKAGIARGKLDGHATRARITSANAKAQRASEAFDKVDAELREWAGTVDPIEDEELEKWKRENL